MKKNKLVKISAIIAAALLISACSTNVRGPQEKIAVINWEQAVSAHPQYAKLEQGEKILQDLLNKRKGQEELAKAQLSSLNKLRSLLLKNSCRSCRKSAVRRLPSCRRKNAVWLMPRYCRTRQRPSSGCVIWRSSSMLRLCSSLNRRRNATRKCLTQHRRP